MDEPVDYQSLLDGCAEEPIHAPGAVQAHGALLAVDAAGRVLVASVNTADVLGRDASVLLGQHLGAILGNGVGAEVLAADQGEPLVVEGLDGSLEVVVRHACGLRLVEIERPPEAEGGDPGRLPKALRAFHGAGDHLTLLGRAARTVRELTGFERVMVYRFDRDWNGEVIVEEVAPGQSSFLGLRFPASDIPPQVRALYARSPLRLIPDITAPPSSLLALDGTAAEALDLAEVSLRAVSPVHLQYLENMGVRASMSLAIHLGDRLWGLVTCHHISGPLRLPLAVREAVDLVGRTTSTVLGAHVARESSDAQVRLLGQVDALTDLLRLDGGDDPAGALVAAGDVFPQLLEAQGAAVVQGPSTSIVGSCPPARLVHELVDHVRATGAGELFVERLASVGSAWEAPEAASAGAAVVRVGLLDDVWLLWFRPETRELVRWGGDPTGKEVRTAGDGRLQLDPRASFDEYLEQVRGVSAPWTAEQVGAARSLAQRVAELEAGRARQRSELTATLQRTVMLEAFPVIPGIDGAARYIPASGAPIGGDWYDVFFREDGTPILALGDVAGHGAGVAATMAQLRHALRAYVIREDTPADAMARLNDLMITLLPKEMATVLLVSVDLVGNRAEIVNAGHLPPIVAGPEGARLIGEHHDVAIGVQAGLSYAPVSVDLPPGAALILYTDGLVERRSQHLDDSIGRLLDHAGRLGAVAADEICDRLIERAGEEADTGDDRTVVAVRLLDVARPRSAPPPPR